MDNTLKAIAQPIQDEVSNEAPNDADSVTEVETQGTQPSSEAPSQPERLDPETEELIQKFEQMTGSTLDRDADGVRQILEQYPDNLNVDGIESIALRQLMSLTGRTEVPSEQAEPIQEKPAAEQVPEQQQTEAVGNPKPQEKEAPPLSDEVLNNVIDAARRLSELQSTNISNPDFYSLLGVNPNADAESIKSGYRTKQRQAHPDTFAFLKQVKEISQNSEQVDAALRGAGFNLTSADLTNVNDIITSFGQVINRANDVLSNPESKKIYDWFHSHADISLSTGLTIYQTYFAAPNDRARADCIRQWEAQMRGGAGARRQAYEQQSQQQSQETSQQTQQEQPRQKTAEEIKREEEIRQRQVEAKQKREEENRQWRKREEQLRQERIARQEADAKIVRDTLRSSRTLRTLFEDEWDQNQFFKQRMGTRIGEMTGLFDRANSYPRNRFPFEAARAMRNMDPNLFVNTWAGIYNQLYRYNTRLIMDFSDDIYAMSADDLLEVLEGVTNLPDKHFELGGFQQLMTEVFADLTMTDEWSLGRMINNLQFRLIYEFEEGNDEEAEQLSDFISELMDIRIKINLAQIRGQDISINDLITMSLSIPNMELSEGKNLRRMVLLSAIQEIYRVRNPFYDFSPQSPGGIAF